MLQKLKNRKAQGGFTLVELLIVIVVIAILAAIVINTFAGVQSKARNTERQTDIKSIASQLEVYYTNTGNYPLGFANITSTVLVGLSPDALKNPQNVAANAFAGTVAPTESQYGYISYNIDGTTACTVAASCQKFTLAYKPEGSAIILTNSLN